MKQFNVGIIGYGWAAGAHITAINAGPRGQVAKVYVDENQMVKAGDVIAELDPADYQVAVENAEAALASAQANAAAVDIGNFTF